MKRLVFQVDDPELLEFIYSLGRSRSDIINLLLRECMEEGGGYVPLRIMAETGFSYKNKKPIKKSAETSTKRNASKPKAVKPIMQSTPAAKAPAVPEEIVYSAPAEQEPATNNTISPVEPENLIPEAAAPEITAVNNVQEDTYVSSAPKIKNKNLAMAGLSAFGGV